jgi:transposase-like protein/IS1 family transposase
MNLQALYCPNPGCLDKYGVGKGNIISHGQKRKRCKCTTCGKTFAYSRGTPFFGLRSEASQIICVVTLVAYGCPIPAIVAAFERDERTIAHWLQRAGVHAGEFHHQQIRGLDLRQVQVDEFWVRMQHQVMWVAMAIAVASRLWLGAVCRPKRDKKLAEQILICVYNWAKPLAALVIAFDGWNVYFDLCLKVFSEPLYTGRGGRPAMRIWQHLTLVQVVKHTSSHTWAGLRQVLWGSCTSLQRIIERTQGAGTINTAYIERLNATFRGHLSILARRSRCPARRVETLTERVYLLGCVYNFCSLHSSLRNATPAMRAGLTHRQWSVADLLWHRLMPFSLPTT